MILSPRQAQTINTGYLFRNQNVNKFKFWPAIGADWLTNVNYLSWSIGKWASFRHNAAIVIIMLQSSLGPTYLKLYPTK